MRSVLDSMTQDHEKKTSLPHMLVAGGIFLEGIWNVTYAGHSAGTCKITRSGLYYKFSCHCKRVTEQVCRLKLECSGEQVDLGIVLPQEDYLLLERQIAVKNIPHGKPVFTLLVNGKTVPEGEQFIPVFEDQPICCLRQLSSARFALRDGIHGIIIKK